MHPETGEGLCDCSGCPYKARYDWAEEVGARVTDGPGHTDAGKDRPNRCGLDPPVGRGGSLSGGHVRGFCHDFLGSPVSDGLDRQWLCLCGFDSRAMDASGRSAQPCRGWHRRWGRRRSGLLAPDRHSVLLSGRAGGHGLSRSGRVCHGSSDAPGGFARQGLRADAVGSCLRDTRHHVDPGHRIQTGSIGDHPGSAPPDLLREDPRLHHGDSSVVSGSTGRGRSGLHRRLYLGDRRRPGHGIRLQTDHPAGRDHTVGARVAGLQDAELAVGSLATLDRSRIFVKRAGTVIPADLYRPVGSGDLSQEPVPEPVLEQLVVAENLEAEGRIDDADVLRHQAVQATAQSGLEHSFAGRLGHWIEPVIAPLGFDWQIGVGILSSFAAREVIVSTLAVVYGVGEAAIDENPGSLYDTLRSATRTDGTPVFTFATSFSLLVFYVLAMQCLPTQAITRRETGGWRWPAFQLGYMTVLAYVSALSVYQLLRGIGIA